MTLCCDTSANGASQSQHSSACNGCILNRFGWRGRDSPWKQPRHTQGDSGTDETHSRGHRKDPWYAGVKIEVKLELFAYIRKLERAPQAAQMLFCSSSSSATALQRCTALARKVLRCRVPTRSTLSEKQRDAGTRAAISADVARFLGVMRAERAVATEQFRPDAWVRCHER